MELRSWNVFWHLQSLFFHVPCLQHESTQGASLVTQGGYALSGFAVRDDGLSARRHVCLLCVAVLQLRHYIPTRSMSLWLQGIHVAVLQLRHCIPTRSMSLWLQGIHVWTANHAPPAHKPSLSMCVSLRHQWKRTPRFQVLQTRANVLRSPFCLRPVKFGVLLCCCVIFFEQIYGR